MLFFEYSYFSTDLRLKIFLYYSLNIIAYDISVLKFIGVSITSVWYLDLYRVTLCMCSTAFRSEAKMSRQTTLGHFGSVSTMPRTIECNHLKQ